MKIQEFSDTIDFLKLRTHREYKWREYFIYLSKDLKKGFVDTILKPHSKNEFDYVIPFASYWARINNWDGYWLDEFGFYDNIYNPCEITFQNHQGKVWKLYEMSYSAIAGKEGFFPIFKLRNEKGEEKEIKCNQELPDFDKSLNLLYAELNEGNNKNQN